MLVEDGRAFLHCRHHVHYGRQHLVLDFDETRGLFGDRRRARGDRRHGVPDVEHLVAGESVVAVVLVADVALGPLRKPFFRAGQIHRRHHSVDAGQGFRTARVDGENARVGVRAAQDKTVGHPRQVDVRAENRFTGHFVRAIVARQTRTDDVELGLLLRTHAFTSPETNSTDLTDETEK